MSKKLSSGHTIQEFPEEEENDLKRRYFLYTDGVVRVNPGGWALPANFIKHEKGIHDFKIRPDDIFVTSFPKSGTTWLQEIVWNLVHNPKLDNPKANSPLDERYCNLTGDIFIATTGVPAPPPDSEMMKRFQMLYPGEDYLDGFIIKLIAHAPSPRMFKTHLPEPLLPSQALDSSKILYIAREPKDVVASYYHYVRLHILFGYEGTLDEFVEDVVNDRVPYAPFWKSLKVAWEHRNHPNFCLVYYEDLKEDPVLAIKTIDKFLGTNRTEKEIEQIAHFTSFEQLKDRFKNKQPTSNLNILFDKDVEGKEGGFFRKGQIGDWKNNFTAEQIEKLNDWIKKNLSEFDDTFKYKNLIN